MPQKNKLLLKLVSWIAFLKTLGVWGVIVLAALDSAAIPIPLDALVAGYVYTNPAHAWLYSIAGAAGSALGSLVPYYLGRAGGELFLLKRIDATKLQSVRDRFERQEFLALMIPAILPPPTPFKVFVFAAGVFEMRLTSFLLSIFSGRLVRFGVISSLTVIFGPEIVNRGKVLLEGHPGVTFLVVMVLGAFIYLVFRLLRSPLKELAKEMHPPEKPRS